ncbi:MAG: ABC transporter permease [Parvibaculaceae bacterium]
MSFDTRKFMNRDDNIVQLVVITLAIFALMTFLSPDKFLRYYNFESITFVFPELGLLAIAMMIAMLTGGIDLSVVGIANLSAILAGLFFHRYVGDVAAASVPAVMLGIALALLTGLAAGLVNGFLITRLRITPILATLGTGQVFAGLAIAITGGPAIVGFPDYWSVLGNGKLLGIPIPFLLFVVTACLVGVILSRTAFGTSLILIGTNAKAAIFAGLARDRLILWSYALTGVLASLAGIILSGRTNAAKADYGTSYLLQAVLIAVLGGTNPAGGRGTVLGISIAVIALMLLASGLQLLRFSNHLIDFIWGAFLLLVIALNAYRAYRKEEK